MRNKKKSLIVPIAICCILIFTIICIFVSKKKNEETSPTLTLGEADSIIQSNTPIKDTSLYENLNFKDFKVAIEGVEGVYNIEILSNTDYKDKSFLENFKTMNSVIDKFFMEDFDKSYIVADFPFGEDVVYVNYYDIQTVCQEEKYNTVGNTFLFGNNTSDGGYMVQIDERLSNVWFSKDGFNDIMPSQVEHKKAYLYLSGVRQGEDIEINLEDGRINLSEMEQKVLHFLNEDFPMEISQNVGFCIGESKILINGEFDGVCFRVRRVYKGIPFEYGSSYATDMYIDNIGHDQGEVSYSSSASPDSMLTFGRINGTIVEKEKITEMISMDEAIQIVSNKIGENSVYDVYGMELVYRQCMVPEEKTGELDAILKPCWKMITVNQNDNKYTLFYVDVVTGKITQRFEYYYE